MRFYAVEAHCPSVSISSSESEYCISEFVQLNATNIAAGSIVEWNTSGNWDTASSNYQGSSIDSGLIDVMLRTTLIDGTICSYDSSGIAYINALPEPDYTLSTNKLCNGPDEIILTDLTENSAKRTWLINEDNFVNPPATTSILFDKIGSSNITLLVEDSAGCRNSKIWNNAVAVYNNIELDFTESNISHCKPVSTNFTPTHTLVGQYITSHVWTLPGSSKPSVNTASVNNAIYSNPGSFYAKLDVNTNTGCTYSKTRGGFMTIGDTANINVVTSKSTICLSEPVTFTETRHPLPGNFDWYIGSSAEKFTSKYIGDFTFRDTGVFDLLLTYNHFNCISTITKTNFVFVAGQKATFVSSNSFHCEAPHTVDLINTSDTIS